MSKLIHETSDQGTGSVTLKVEDITGDHVLTLPPQSGALASLGAGGMPQTDDGTPVVASGSNNDGSWTRWADGTQHSAALSLDIDIDVADGSIFYGAVTMPLPQPLHAIGDSSGSAVDSASSVIWGGCIAINTGQVRVFLFRSISAQNRRAKYSIIGRWKA